MQKKIDNFISADINDDKYSFEELALELFEYQYERVPLYRQFCDARQASPSSVSEWQQVPALPADAFKQQLIDHGEEAHVFLSSGTSEGLDKRSRHQLTTLSTYRLSAMTFFNEMVLPDEPGSMSVLLAGPGVDSHPDSSLGRMFSWVYEETANADSEVVFDGDGEFDSTAALEWLGRMSSDNRPVLLLAVSSALTALLARMREKKLSCRLPGGSRIVDTGGRKGAAPTYSAAGMRKACWRYLHVPGYMCVNEYGMTEMLSQYYDDALVGRHRGRIDQRIKAGPRWCRHVVVSPATLQPVADGEVGLLRHTDLANWESVSALQTLDLARRVGDGFQLVGRASTAQLRGCSQLLTMAVT